MGKLLFNDNAFNRIMSKVFDLILLGFFTIICSLPVITAGAASLSAYRILLEMADDTEGPVSSSFFRYFKYALKNNFLDSLKGSCILSVSLTVLVADLFFLTKMNMQYRSLMYGVIIVLLISVIAINDWYFSLKATFNEGSIKTLKNSVGFFFVYLIQSLLAGGYTVAALYLLTRFPYVIGIIIFFGNALLKYPKILLYKNKIDKYLVDRGIESEVSELKDTYEEPESIADEFGKMSVKQKVDHIFTYYKGHFAFAGIIVLIAGVIIHQVFFADHRDCYNVAVVNAYIKEGDVAISDRLSESLVSNTSKEKVYFDTQYQLEYPGVSNRMADTSFQEKLLLNIGVGSVDVAILPKKFVDFCNESEYIFRDVSKVLGEDKIRLFENNLIYSEDENGKKFPCGIYISDTEFIDNEEFSFIEGSKGDEVIMVFPANADNDAFCNEFADMLVGSTD
ncbi:MAG: YesL family protein [Eubacterium sp.]|nr:YesL family protein [Eubacterium sp.]